MKIYIVDAFTNSNFRGNPAGVCLLDSKLPDNELQNIAMGLLNSDKQVMRGVI